MIESCFRASLSCDPKGLASISQEILIKTDSLYAPERHPREAGSERVVLLLLGAKLLGDGLGGVASL
jgi:hypothetical protein